jgi:hypothetical protein
VQFAAWQEIQMLAEYEEVIGRPPKDMEHILLAAHSRRYGYRYSCTAIGSNIGSHSIGRKPTIQIPVLVETRTSAPEHCGSAISMRGNAPQNSAFGRFEALVYGLVMERLRNFQKRVGLHYWKRILNLVRCQIGGHKLFCGTCEGIAVPETQCVPHAEIIAGDGRQTASSDASASSYYTASEAPWATGFWIEQSHGRTLQVRLRQVGGLHPWHKMSLEDRREALRAYHGVAPGRPPIADFGPPPSARLSEQELADFEDLLQRLLRWRRVDRESAASICDHPWLNRNYAPLDSDAPFLMRYYTGETFQRDGEVYI